MEFVVAKIDTSQRIGASSPSVMVNYLTSHEWREALRTLYGMDPTLSPSPVLPMPSRIEISPDYSPAKPSYSETALSAHHLLAVPAETAFLGLSKFVQARPIFSPPPVAPQLLADSAKQTVHELQLELPQLET